MIGVPLEYQLIAGTTDVLAVEDCTGEDASQRRVGTPKMGSPAKLALVIGGFGVLALFPTGLVLYFLLRKIVRR
jgi:hypothetical protein